MATSIVKVPDELLVLLRSTRLGARSRSEQVQIALAIHLFLEGVVSIGKAAELAGEPRIEFEHQLIAMGLPTVRYDIADYDEDLRGLTHLKQQSPSS